MPVVLTALITRAQIGIFTRALTDRRCLVRLPARAEDYGGPQYRPSYGPEYGGGGGDYRPGYGGGYPADNDGYDDAPPATAAGLLPPPGLWLRRRLWWSSASRRWGPANQPCAGLLQRLRQPDLLSERLDGPERTMSALPRPLTGPNAISHPQQCLKRVVRICLCFAPICSAAVHELSVRLHEGERRQTDIQGETQMLRLVLLSLGAALYVTSAQAHGVHADCRVGDTWMGVVPHFHPGAYGRAIASAAAVVAAVIMSRLLRLTAAAITVVAAAITIPAINACHAGAITARRPIADRTATTITDAGFAARNTGRCKTACASPIAAAEPNRIREGTPAAMRGFSLRGVRRV